jgi:hypothetical protein
MQTHPRPVDASVQQWLDLTDEALIASCEIDLYRASGPGGQKRNKTSSAVRLRHAPTGLMVTATESRSQHENRARALKRLRRAIALTQRTLLQPDEPHPECLASARQRDGSFRLSRRHHDYCRVVQYVLDVLWAAQGRLNPAARRLNISTGQLVSFLKGDPKLWEHANRLRQSLGQRPLK